MSIQILPARLANQIAAGEVVERPASVIKELVENSLDAGATTIKIQIEKGGAKRIKISDNGVGIPKDELTLALSRHATSKIKTLNDLEGISSLGFRGEALASISSVSRLTLTSKPKDQDSAWQATSEGRDMEVEITPSAHPNGTSIDVQDLFFNTPARRKFLKTDKTEFTHIEEIIKRIALARLDVTFVLIHNEKIIRQYRAANTKQQYSKRVAQVCGQKFIDHAIEVECEHNDLHFSGWLAKPSYSRNQNDLCYSYVNGRMMKDKLINHAIRQAYENLLPSDTYPAFVLFLTLNHRDVDVNVHPAKHEVRFHQGRYVHDFIFSVCKRALQEDVESNIEGLINQPEENTLETKVNNDALHSNLPTLNQTSSESNKVQYNESINHSYRDQSYIKPLTEVNEQTSITYNRAPSYSKPNIVSKVGNDAYHALLSNTYEQDSRSERKLSDERPLSQQTESICVLHIVSSVYALIEVNKELRLLSLSPLHKNFIIKDLSNKWEQGFVSQPLLLPIKLELDVKSITLIESNLLFLEKLGITLHVLNNKNVQIREFPALLRHKDIAGSFDQLIKEILLLKQGDTLTGTHWLTCFSSLLALDSYSVEDAKVLINKMKMVELDNIEAKMLLNSVPVDLTSELRQLMLL